MVGKGKCSQSPKMSNLLSHHLAHCLEMPVPWLSVCSMQTEVHTHNKNQGVSLLLEGAAEQPISSFFSLRQVWLLNLSLRAPKCLFFLLFFLFVLFPFAHAMSQKRRAAAVRQGQPSPAEKQTHRPASAHSLHHAIIAGCWSAERIAIIFYSHYARQAGGFSGDIAYCRQEKGERVRRYGVGRRFSAHGTKLPGGAYMERDREEEGKCRHHASHFIFLHVLLFQLSGI